MADWTLLTNHGLVLVSVARNPEKTARDIGNDIGLTERTTHKIIIELEKEGYITRTKQGRQNTYRIHPGMTIKDPVTDASIGELLATLGWQRKRG
jgi:CTP-dependent riboflavin kinase